MRRCIDYYVSTGTLIMFALAMLILPMRWLLAWSFAVCFHEACHYAAVCLCGGEVRGFSLEPGSVGMTVEDLSRGQELFCALAGPVGSLSLLLVARWFPALAVCALFQSVYNLMPLYPLDGGRALRCAMELLLPERIADQIVQWIGYLFLALLWVVAVCASVWLRLGFMPLILALTLHMKTKFGKIPCKRSHKRVQ